MWGRWAQKGGQEVGRLGGQQLLGPGWRDRTSRSYGTVGKTSAQSWPCCDPRVDMSYGSSEPWSPCPLRHCGFTDAGCTVRVVTLDWAPLPAPQPCLLACPACLPSASLCASAQTLSHPRPVLPHRPGIPCLPVGPRYQDPLGLPLPRPSQHPATSSQSLVPSGLPPLRPGHLLMSLIPRGGWVSVSRLGGQTGQAMVGIGAFAQQQPFPSSLL